MYSNTVSGTYNYNDPNMQVYQQQALMPTAQTQPQQGNTGSAISQATKNIIQALMKAKQQQAQSNQANQQAWQQAQQQAQPTQAPQQVDQFQGLNPVYGGGAMFQQPPSADSYGYGGGWGGDTGGY